MPLHVGTPADKARVNPSLGSAFAVTGQFASSRETRVDLADASLAVKHSIVPNMVQEAFRDYKKAHPDTHDLSVDPNYVGDAGPSAADKAGIPNLLNGDVTIKSGPK